MHKRGFASDNNAGVHPDIMKVLSEINDGHAVGYGDDVYTKQAERTFKNTFGEDVEVAFAYNGTGANVIALQALTQSYNSIICAQTAHINVDECGAPEKHTGCKLIAIPTSNGKLTPELIKQQLHGFGFEHHSQPKVVSITQATELGTVYTIDEIKAIAQLVHEYNMYLHMDGARLANATVALNTSLKEITFDAGVDVLSFGGTKNGLMFGEAIVFKNKTLFENVKYIRKQTTQLHSKMRYISAQFDSLLSTNVWSSNAQHANKMAAKLAKEIEQISEIEVTQKVESNGVFAIVPPDIIEPLKQEYFFYEWDESRSEVRWMTSFDTTEEDIDGFVSKIKSLLS